jgi:hypothetical protein
MTDEQREPDEFHTVQIMLDDCTDGALATYRCTAPEGSTCRMRCPEGCEEWPCGHDLIDGGRCNVVEWLEACSRFVAVLVAALSTPPKDTEE